MGYFPVRYDSRFVIYERKIFIRLATVILIYYILGCTVYLSFSLLVSIDLTVLSFLI